MNRLLSTAALLVFLTFSPSRLAWAQSCHENCISCTFYEIAPVCSMAPQFDTPAPACVYGDAGGYNIPWGTLYSVALDPFGCCGIRTTVEDEFTVTGLPEGTPISFQCQFYVVVDAGCILGPGTARAGMEVVGGESQQSEWEAYLFGGEPLDTTFVVPLELEAGVSFSMRYFAETSFGECNGSVVGTFSFSGLPEEATVVSCNGFIDGPVQTESTSWGRVKATYR